MNIVVACYPPKLWNAFLDQNNLRVKVAGSRNTVKTSCSWESSSCLGIHMVSQLLLEGVSVVMFRKSLCTRSVSGLGRA